MAPIRRLKFILISALAFTVMMLFYTSGLRDSQPRDDRTVQDIYHKTKGALYRGGSGAQQPPQQAPPISVDMDNDGDVDEEDARLARAMQERLKAAEQQAKDQANAKAPNRPDTPSNLVGVGSSANGQHPQAAAAEGGDIAAPGAAGAAPAAAVPAAAAPAAAAPAAVAPSAAAPAPAAEDDGIDPSKKEEMRAVATELDSIFARAPVIIFSKSYCPFSKRAKGVLLDKYVIEPAPVVIELDMHPLGTAIQTQLARLTNRRTVPNVLINGYGLGGSDEIAELDANKQLIAKVQSLGKGKVVMKERLAV